MPITVQNNVPWTRKHDLPGTPHFAQVPEVLFPETDSLKELIARCKARNPAQRMRAAGSHWALSDAAISDFTFIETHDPSNALPAMSRTLFEVIPGCMTPEFIDAMVALPVKPFDANPDNVSTNEGLYLVHIETGKRVYQLYSEMDLGQESEPRSLAALLNRRTANRYAGPWGFQTLGGAGGQTVFGALTTGTHGGDFKMPPIADSVMAMHLVADGGKHYWIEPESTGQFPRMTDDDKLRAVYGPTSGDPNDFVVVRDDTLFNAVLVSAGRFGMVYSIVLKAVRQYCLHEERRLRRPTGQDFTWQQVRSLIADPTNDFFQKPMDAGTNGTAGKNRFMQIAVCLTPHNNFTSNLVGITKRWNVALEGPDPLTPFGRAERRGDPPLAPDGTIAIDGRIQGPRFPMAGNSHPYSPDAGGFMERACAESNFMEGLIQVVHDEIHNLVHNNAVVIGGAVAAVAAVGGAAALAALFPALLIILAILLAFKHLLQSYGANKPRLGQVLNDLRDELLDQPDPARRAAGVFAWQCIAYKIFEMMQKNLDFSAVSYAVMDRHDYLQRSCEVNVDSIEVFFPADHPMLPAFVDALIAFEIQQEGQGRAFVGYASLRFTGPTRALIGMETAPTTCAVEVAGLRDVEGTRELIDFATALALNPNFNGILHWGQRNDSTMAHIQARFGDSQASPTGRLRRWRQALSRVTDNGRLDGFSSNFTRFVGLEIVLPQIQSFAAQPTNTAVGQIVTVDWDCGNNPAAVEIELEILSPSAVRTLHSGLGRTGQIQFVASETGTYNLRLTAVLRLNAESRRTNRGATVSVA